MVDRIFHSVFVGLIIVGIKKTWVTDAPDKILVEQTYPGDEENLMDSKDF